MATHIIPSSYRCYCGYECGFAENTVREMGKVSQRKTQYLVEDGHRIEFSKGKAVAVHCPTLGRCLTMSTKICDGVHRWRESFKRNAYARHP